MKNKSFFESDKFAKVLAEDVIRAKQRMEEEPSDFHLREFVRTAYSAIEAQSWQLRMYLIEYVIDKKTASVHEISALKEESYAINEKGEIYIQPKGYSLKIGLRLAFTVLKKHEVPIQIDFGSPEWMNIDLALKIRNRVIHPRNMTDISVSKEEAECCYQAFVYVNNILLNTILGSAFAGINKALTGKNKSSFFSSAK